MPTERTRIVADENIPGLGSMEVTFGAFEKVPAADITREKLRAADALLVRSVTRVDAELLRGTAVRFVGTATAGTDHADVAYLRSAGIGFAHAPGSNAESVVEYVLAALLVLCTREGRKLRGITVGVIGCGEVGGRLARRLESIGVRVLRNDPPLAKHHPEQFLHLEEVMRTADVVSLHTPLERHGPHPTHHLIGREQIETMKQGVWFINASRGSVVDSDALQGGIDEGRVGHAVLDVWEGEPQISRDLLDRATIATPHIAGYSYDAKLAGSRMVLDALAKHFGCESIPAPLDDAPTSVLQPPDPVSPLEESLRYLSDQMYDVVADDRRLRDAIAGGAAPAEAFRRLRRNYPERRSFRRFAIGSQFLEPGLRQTAQNLLQIAVAAEVPV